ncbi:MAG: RHS repeat-associated core domain-containing protein [Calditrichaceae bacterium]|nr:RHS repeat-associated core domain-containing protein [Calditrichaceae bacterium]MBN2708948.1 RHS repeat-associated core domain-containing protein [Calditrichaceae bacterium]RQV97529.1 MAG: RHS repeat-associated core domain-containing protein [Calditrichota bacterium]
MWSACPFWGYYFGARYYDPEIARWLTIDPMTNKAPDMTPYHYTHNNPINRIDPDGKNDPWAMAIANRYRMAEEGTMSYETLEAVTEGETEAARTIIEVGADTYGDACEVATGYTITGQEGSRATAAVALAVPFVSSAVVKMVGGFLKSLFKGAEKTETVQRVMSKAEAVATKETGLVRGGREGTHFVTDAANSNANRARQRLALPSKPEVKATMEVPAGSFSKPTKVQPANNMPGGGTERTATGNIPAKIVKEEELK